MRLITVHGINSDGASGVDKLATEVQHNMLGLELVNFDYPKISLFNALSTLSFWRYEKVRTQLAQQLFDISQDGDHIVAHSFGAAVVHACMSKLGRKFGCVWLVAPALSIDDQLTGFANQQFDSLTLIFNPYDRALRFGRWLPWVDMSELGLKGNLIKSQHNIELLPMPQRYLRNEHADWLNHSYAFSGNNLRLLTEKLSQQLMTDTGVE